MSGRDRADQAAGAALDAAVSAVASPAAAKAARPITRRLAPIIVSMVAAAAIAGLLVFSTAAGGVSLLTLMVADALTRQQTSGVAFCSPGSVAGDLSGVSSLSRDEETRGRQLGNALLLVKTGERRGVEPKGWVTAVAVGFVESHLLNLPSAKYPESSRYPHDTYEDGSIPAGDHTSVGLMQQQRWWWHDDMSKGMNPAYQAAQFYGGDDDTPTIPGLLDIPGWENLPVGVAAQAVQRSAFPTRYSDVEADATAIVAFLSGVDPGTCVGPTATGDWQWPLDPLPPVSSPFGMRLHPVLGYWKLHDGTDYGAACGTPIYAVGPGEVTTAGMLTGYGGTTVINHGGGVETWYTHQANLTTPVGTQVAGGQQIGAVGTTGYSTGCHLHWMVKIDGEPVDPVPWLTTQIAQQQGAGE